MYLRFDALSDKKGAHIFHKTPLGASCALLLLFALFGAFALGFFALGFLLGRLVGC